MRLLYFDCFSGISGDMSVGALLDLGIPGEYLKEQLSMLKINDEYSIEIHKKVKGGIEGTDFNVILKNPEGQEERNLFEIEAIIDSSSLNENVKKLSKEMFYKVAEAESIVHGKNLYEVHFHEVGATDSIVDIVGTAICIDYLKPDVIYSSPVNTGKGFVKCMHGVIPVPAPATVQILKDVPVYNDDREFELTTPTGAAIIKVLAKDYKCLPQIRIKKVGYGCGKRETEKPNVLRVFIAEEPEFEMSILEATIDDMNPQFCGYVMDKLFEEGAKDVYFCPVYMKKNRPGIVITVTTSANLEDKMREVLFRETTTIGIRKYSIQRTELRREFETLDTIYGSIKMKIAKYNDDLANVSPEYEDMKAAAEKYGVPLKEVYNNTFSEYRRKKSMNS